MANPVVTAIPANTWVKVATAVQAGRVHILVRSVDLSPAVYSQTYRTTGGVAPVDGVMTEAALMPFPGVPIVAAANIDVYITCNVLGSVRVDL